MPLEKFGLHWVHPDFPLAHPLDGAGAVCLRRSIRETAARLDADGAAYERLFLPLERSWPNLASELLRPMLHWPRHPLSLARFGVKALSSAARLGNRQFAGEAARALFAGLSAHSFLPLETRTSASFALVLGTLAHVIGWPMVRGGSQNFANALAAHLRSLGGEVMTNMQIASLDQLPLARATLFDVTPRQLLALAGEKLPVSYRQRLDRFRYGPGVFKIDYALSGPIPWLVSECGRAGTVHLGGTMREISEAEQTVAQGEHPLRPFVLLAQPTVFDPTRAPAGQHTAWVYCHVPNGSRVDMSERIEQQIERFAPGFRDCILARRSMHCGHMEQHNPNLIGGDINGGASDWRQLLARPTFSPAPYRIPVPGLYLCSASTPPGGGVHGMCGFHAAETAIRDIF